MAVFSNWTDAWFAFQAAYPSVVNYLQMSTNERSNEHIQTTIIGLRNSVWTWMGQIENAIRAHTGIYWAEPLNQSSQYMTIYYAHGGALDMATLLNTMLAAEFEELTKFIGIEDAYRAAIWDQPFNAQFYAALAQGFRQWG